MKFLLIVTQLGGSSKASISALNNLESLKIIKEAQYIFLINSMQ